MLENTRQLDWEAVCTRAWTGAHICKCPGSLELQFLLVIVAQELYEPLHNSRLSHNFLYGWLLLYRKKLPEVACGFQLEVTVLGHKLLNLHSQAEVALDLAAFWVYPVTQNQAVKRSCAGKLEAPQRSAPDARGRSEVQCCATYHRCVDRLHRFEVDPDEARNMVICGGRCERLTLSCAR